MVEMVELLVSPCAHVPSYGGSPLGGLMRSTPAGRGLRIHHELTDLPIAVIVIDRRSPANRNPSPAATFGVCGYRTT
jgi:hypothetical protein